MATLKESVASWKSRMTEASVHGDASTILYIPNEIQDLIDEAEEGWLKAGSSKLLELTDEEIADVKYATLALYHFCQFKKNKRGVLRWGVIIEKLNAIYPYKPGTANDEEYIQKHLEGKYTKEVSPESAG